MIKRRQDIIQIPWKVIKEALQSKEGKTALAWAVIIKFAYRNSVIQDVSINKIQAMAHCGRAKAREVYKLMQCSTRFQKLTTGENNYLACSFKTDMIVPSNRGTCAVNKEQCYTLSDKRTSFNRKSKDFLTSGWRLRDLIREFSKIAILHNALLIEDKQRDGRPNIIDKEKATCATAQSMPTSRLVKGVGKSRQAGSYYLNMVMNDGVLAKVQKGKVHFYPAKVSEMSREEYDMFVQKHYATNPNIPLHEFGEFLGYYESPKWQVNEKIAFRACVYKTIYLDKKGNAVKTIAYPLHKKKYERIAKDGVYHLEKTEQVLNMDCYISIDTSYEDILVLGGRNGGVR